MVEPLRVAVIGVGRMGQHHARLYTALPDAVLVAVADANRGQADRVGRQHGAACAYGDYRQMLRDLAPDAVSVAVPTSLHREVGVTAMQHGAAVLIEKPLAATAVEAGELADYAEKRGVVLAVGHVERCNPMVHEVKRLIDAGELGRVYRVSVTRVGPDPVRVRDVGVVVDLATHDLDVLRYLLDEEPAGYQVHLQYREHTPFEDGCMAIMTFPSGIVAVLECDWLTPTKMRSLVVVGSEGAVTVSYDGQTGLVYRRDQEFAMTLSVPKAEPLRVELERFLQAVRGEGQPAAIGEDGVAALRMAERILKVGTR